MKYSERKLKLKLENHITYDSFWENPTTIPMELRGSDEAEENNEVPKICDFFDWHYNYSFGTTDPPSAYYYIVSEKMKNIFERFTLPPHKYYEIEVTNVEVEQKYFVLHALSHKHYVDYKKSSFVMKDPYTGEILENIEINIQSKSDYFSTLRNKDEGFRLSFKTEYYDKKYDCLPNSFNSNYPIINESLKRELEKANLIGIDFYEYNQDGFDIPILFPE
ncbi:hypothetical protein [Flammeovirga aprica]|uniref:Immunity protein 43 domain-containing protein n=1 Tax=Flammeovirga aprica JL-4 TaxID=694437 RepID=A0A7X9P0Q9_9BACT|nr:hypothetical protein [Flammeovirga aprica]NME67388.1 hypothetical protein [Flammeovirga aprica JL-4]